MCETLGDSGGSSCSADGRKCSCTSPAGAADSACPATMNVADLWRSSSLIAWEEALQRYWLFVQPRNMELEKALDALDVRRLQGLSPQGWYDFLHDVYFQRKYTAPNRYATTRSEE